jgi:hypothetical protein
MTELAVHLPTELALQPQDLLDEASIPLLPASKIARGQFHPDRIPASIARVADVANQIQEAIQGLGGTGGDDLSAEVDALFEAVEGKADATHTHPDLEAAIGTKAGATHTHTDLETAIAGKADLNHTHTGLPIVSGTAPSSPAVGQRWLDTGDRLTWFWDGTYWLSESIYTHSVSAYAATMSATTFPHAFAPHPSYNLFFLRIYAAGIFQSGTYNASNFWDCRLFRDGPAGVQGNETTLFTVQTTLASVSFAVFSAALNFHRDVAALGITTYRVGFQRTGTPPDVNSASAKFEYRLAKR